MTENKLFKIQLAIGFCIVGMVFFAILETFDDLEMRNENDILQNHVLELGKEIKDWEQRKFAYECDCSCVDLTKCWRRAKALEDQAIQCVNEKLGIKDNK